MIGADLVKVARDHTPDEVWRRHVSAWMATLTWRAAGIFGGSTGDALTGVMTREAVQLRQLAIYVGHTICGIEQVDCAEALGVSRQAAQRALQTIERQRETDETFAARLENLEAIATRLREVA